MEPADCSSPKSGLFGVGPVEATSPTRGKSTVYREIQGQLHSGCRSLGWGRGWLQAGDTAPYSKPLSPPPGEEKGCISPTSLGRPVASLEPLNSRAEEELSNLSPAPLLHSWGTESRGGHNSPKPCGQGAAHPGGKKRRKGPLHSCALL